MNDVDQLRNLLQQAQESLGKVQGQLKDALAEVRGTTDRLEQALEVLQAIEDEVVPAPGPTLDQLRDAGDIAPWELIGEKEKDRLQGRWIAVRTLRSNPNECVMVLWRRRYRVDWALVSPEEGNEEHLLEGSISVNDNVEAEEDLYLRAQADADQALASYTTPKE